MKIKIYSKDIYKCPKSINGFNTLRTMPRKLVRNLEML
jgi:hypothetical protein